MDQPLVVFDEDDTKLLTEAGELAAGVDAELTVLSLMTAEEFREARETLDVVAQEEHTNYDDSVVIDAAKRQARDVVEDLYDDLDLEWKIIGAHRRQREAGRPHPRSGRGRRGRPPVRHRPEALADRQGSVR